MFGILAPVAPKIESKPIDDVVSLVVSEVVHGFAACRREGVMTIRQSIARCDGLALGHRLLLRVFR